MKSKNNNLDKNKNNPIDININPRSQKTTINTIESQKRGQKSLEPSVKKISKKKLEEKFSKNKMLVALRARPLLNRELEESNYSTISVPDRETVIISIPTEYVSNDKGKYYFKGEKKIKITKVKEAEFKYDFAFDEKSDQEEIYQFTTANLVKQVINGFNATVFAYGATGTGKTYTMVGGGDNWGLMIRSISDLFKTINNEKEKKYIIKISYVEIYNEIIKDLLADQINNKNNQLEIRTDSQKGVVLQGVEFKKVTNESDAYKLIMRGNKHRTEKLTSYNENSSRSHAILQIYIEIEEQLSPTLNKEKAFGKFVLVDLAGCEKTPILGKKNAESGSINKSLLALGKCIIALTSPNKGYISWRDSKLTRLLQEPLSGNSRIVMIATVSPSIDSFDETMFTLQYAQKAKNVKVVMRKNVVDLETPRINKYDELIQNLREEIEEINEQIGENQKVNNISNGEIDQPNSNNISFNNMNNSNINNNANNNTNNNNFIHNDEYDKIQKDIVNHFQNEINLKKKIVEKENIIEDLKNELSEQEYELIHAPKINQNYLKSKIESKRSDINDKTQKMSKGYIKQSELITKRKELQAIISKLAKADPNNAQVKNLYNIYKYYLNLLDSINTEHRKGLTLNELKRKEKKITILTEQLDLRDLFIRNAYQELASNNVEFKYKNPKIISSDEIELAPTRPPIVRISPSFKSLSELANNMQMNNINIYKNMPQSESKARDKNDNKNSNSPKSKNYQQLLKHEQELKELDEIKKRIVKDTKISKKRQFNNEVLNLFKYNPKIAISTKGGLDLNLFDRQKASNSKKFNIQSQTLVNAGERAVVNNINKVNTVKNPTFQNYLTRGGGNRNYNFRYDGNGNLIRNNLMKKSNLNNLSFSRDNNSFSKSSSQIEITNTSPLENEVQKKVKTILKKDYIGRYKRSPYLRILGQ